MGFAAPPAHPERTGGEQPKNVVVGVPTYEAWDRGGKGHILEPKSKVTRNTDTQYASGARESKPEKQAHNPTRAQTAAHLEDGLKLVA